MANQTRSVQVSAVFDPDQIRNRGWMLSARPVTKNNARRVPVEYVPDIFDRQLADEIRRVRFKPRRAGERSVYFTCRGNGHVPHSESKRAIDCKIALRASNQRSIG